MRRNASRVAARRRVARLDRVDARGHEAREDAVDVLVEGRVLERDPRLRGQRVEQLLGALVEADDLRLDVSGPASRSAGSRLRLISCTTPMISPCAETIGATSIDLLR